jgi:tripeptide aminopeptidase
LQPSASALFSSPLAEELAEDILERFLRYVRIDTQAAYGSDSYPSTPGQLELSNLLADELRGLGIDDAEVDEYGYVFATVPGSAGPTVGLLAHVDTSPDAPGSGVAPQVIPGYEGGPVVLPGSPEQVLTPEDSPLLAERVGHDIVTTDGTTLLGADDKAGVAEIMAAVAYLAAHPEVPHAPLRIAFTVDEEVGRGTEYLDLEAFGAEFAYTMDGARVGEIENETFSALEATVTIKGRSAHPGTAKGKLVNAVKLAARLIASLPPELSPEATEGRQGFLHPTDVTGTTEGVKIRIILRDFDDRRLESHAELLRGLVQELSESEPRARISLEVAEVYRNMKEVLDAHPQILAAAEEAVRRAGLEPTTGSIRGGTDGSMLSARGLPTPNIFTGGNEYHSVREWISVQDMAAAAATIVELARLWAEPAWARPS